jgi:hypothetical protein
MNICESADGDKICGGCAHRKPHHPMTQCKTPNCDRRHDKKGVPSKCLLLHSYNHQELDKILNDI